MAVAVGTMNVCSLQKGALASLPRRSVRGPSSAMTRRVVVRAAEEKQEVIKPLNGDPFIGMLETPVTSAPIVAGYLSNLPAYRTGVSPLLRGIEIGLAHGFLLIGPFYKAGPLRNTDSALFAGTLSAAALVLILTLCLTMYGTAKFQGDDEKKTSLTLTGREFEKDQLQTSSGWSGFTAGFLFGGEAGVLWAALLLSTGKFAYFT